MTESTNNHETSVGSDRTEAQAVPFEASCRARALSDNVEFATCLVQEPQYCPYAWHCGWNWICTHPRCREIVARTQEEYRPSNPTKTQVELRSSLSGLEKRRRDRPNAKLNGETETCGFTSIWDKCWLCWRFCLSAFLPSSTDTVSGNKMTLNEVQRPAMVAGVSHRGSVGLTLMASIERSRAPTWFNRQTERAWPC